MQEGLLTPDQAAALTRADAQRAQQESAQKQPPGSSTSNSTPSVAGRAGQRPSRGNQCVTPGGAPRPAEPSPAKERRKSKSTVHPEASMTREEQVAKVLDLQDNITRDVQQVCMCYVCMWCCILAQNVYVYECSDGI